MTNKAPTNKVCRGHYTYEGHAIVRVRASGMWSIISFDNTWTHVDVIRLHH